MPKYLIKGGYVLQFDGANKATFPKLDVLIEDNIISKIGPDLDHTDASVEVLDASDHIVSPGFIDGHRHIFQAQLRGTVSNHAFLDYCSHLLQGRMTFLDANDMYLAQLSGASEAIWSGITTVMDHSHAVSSRDRAERCVEATVESGIRSIYCPAPFMNPESLNPMVLPDMEKRHPEQVDLFKSLAAQKPLGGSRNDGRVTLGLGYDTMYYRPQDEVRELLQFCKDNDIPVTSHDVDRFNLPALGYLQSNNMPIPKFTLSHTCEPTEERKNFIKTNEIGVVSTPETEMAMGHGHPSAWELLDAGCRASLGVDVSAYCSGDMFHCMRVGLANQRGRDNAELHSRSKVPNVVKARIDQALYMGTLGAAKAIHREKDLGSLEPGKLADVILIRTDSPSMVAATEFSSLLVLHASASDVDLVLVNGEIVKRGDKLLRVDWPKLVPKLRENRRMLEERWKHVDWETTKAELIQLWHMSSVLE